MDQSTVIGAAETDTVTRTRASQQEYALLAGQKRVLELIATGAPLDDTLTELIHFIESQEDRLRCGILIVTADGDHFRRGCGPNLPEIYHQTLDNVPITPPYLGACGEAAHADRPVIVPDIANDGRWARIWRDLVLSCGLKACRSTPVHASNGRVIASFAMYYDHPRDPHPAHPELIEIATHLASIALEHEHLRADAVLRESERQSNALLDALPVAVYKTDTAGKITYYNQAAIQLAGRQPRLGSDEWCVSWRLYRPDGRPMPHDECPMAITLKENRAINGGEAIAERPDGTRVPFLAFPRPLRDASGALTGAVNTLVDISGRQRSEAALRRQTHRLRTLNRAAQLIAGDLDLERIMQSVTDAATDITGAQFGAFFYNVVDGDGEHYMLFTLSGAPRETFSKFDMPRNTSMFGTTFRGEGIVRCDDVRTDPRYGNNAPHFGIPKGHPPVVSYLAVPVISRSGETLGGLFFGHDQSGVFTQETEDIAAGIAAHTAVAVDNARLFDAAQTEIERSKRVERAAQQLAAIVESSDDAIASKDLNGIILTWNDGAERLFGYTAEEAVGRPINILIPPDREDEEPEILARIRNGQPVDHYDTVRRRKDGTLIDVSLTISPIRDSAGNIIGASKIARDISERRAAEAHRELLLHELSHRVKNTLATVQSIAQQTLRQTPAPEAFQQRFVSRLAALSHTHDLLMRTNWHGAALRDLVAMELRPYGGARSARWTVAGPPVLLNSKSALALGMAFHELATNAAKYGALSTPRGQVEVSWQVATDSGNRLLRFSWLERGGPRVIAPDRRGFGSRLIEEGLAFELGAAVTLAFEPAGVRCTLDLPLDSISNEKQA